MGLFLDRPISSIEDLANYESGIVNVASNEGIDLAIKLKLSQQELGMELSRAFRNAGYYDNSGYYDLRWPVQSRLTLDNVVVTEPLRSWHIFQTLVLTYRDAYNNQLNDRYRNKWNEYKDLSKWAFGLLAQTGVGIVWDPIAQAGVPEIDSTPGPFLAATYFVRTSWVNERGEEGAPSEAKFFSAPNQHQLRVSVKNPPRIGRGWNVFVGTTAEEASLQNAAPLALKEKWMQPPSGLSTGRRPGAGQEPNYLRVLPRWLQRG